MKTRLVTFVALLTLAVALAAQTVEELVAQGRAALAAHEIGTANARFVHAVALSPDHETANVLYGISRVLALPYQPPGSNFLTRLGFSLEGRNLYNWTAIPPRDTNGVPYAPVGVSANEITAFLRTNVLPEISGALANLAKVASPRFVVNLNVNETALAGADVDYGDVLMIRAVLHAAEYGIYTINAQNFEAQLAAIHALYTSGQLSIERVLRDHPQLLTFATTNDLIAARTAILNAADRYLEASTFIRARPYYVTRLFNLDEHRAKDEELFRASLEDLKAAIYGLRAMHFDTNYTVSLVPHFTGTRDWRSMLPAFRSNSVVLGTLPDTTFGGTVFGLTEFQIEDELGVHFHLVPRIELQWLSAARQPLLGIHSQSKRGYAIQASTDLRGWEDVNGFFNLGRPVAFLDGAATNHPHRFYRAVDRTTNMPPPRNDHFTNRIPISGLNVVVEGYATGATSEPNDPLPAYGTTWWSWIAPSSGSVSVLFRGKLEIVKVWAGAALGQLSPVAEGWGGREVPFNAVAGTEYQIEVAAPQPWHWGWGEPEGLRLVLCRPPVVNIIQPVRGAFFETPVDIPIIAAITNGSVNVRTVRFYAGNMHLGKVSTAPYSLLWSNAPPGDHWLGVGAMDDLGFEVLPALGAVDVRIRPGNDQFAKRFKILSTPTRVRGFGALSTLEPGEPQHAGVFINGSLWWSWTAPISGGVTLNAKLVESYTWQEAPALAVYTGTSLTNLFLIASNQFNGIARSSLVTFAAVSNITYQIALGFARSYEPPPTEVELGIVPSAAPSVILATPSFPSSNSITLTADATDADGMVTQVSFHAGQRLLSTITSPPYTFTWDDRRFGAYLITARAVDNDGVIGVAQLSVLNGANDRFNSRAALAGKKLTVVAVNTNAAKEPGEPNHAGYAGGKSVWWTWTASTSGPVTIATTGSDFDTILGIYTGGVVTGLNLVADDDDRGGNRTSLVRFDAVAGTAYLIAVDGYNAASGNVVLMVTQQ